LKKSKRSDAGHFLPEVKAQNKQLSKCPASLGLNGNEKDSGNEANAFEMSK
jgi:hypothetical protein